MDKPYNPYLNGLQPTPKEEVAPKIKNGIYTIESPTNGHRTFRIKTQAETAKFAPGTRIVSLLTGPDNNNHYQGFAFVRQDENGFNLWKKYRGIHDERTEYEWYASMLLDMLTNPESKCYKTGYKLLREERCIRCNRRLTTPTSIRKGIGPECEKIVR